MKTLTPEPEIVYFGEPNGPSPPEGQSEKVGGFAPQWVGSGEGPSGPPKSTISGSRGRGLLIDCPNYWGVCFAGRRFKKTIKTKGVRRTVTESIRQTTVLNDPWGWAARGGPNQSLPFFVARGSVLRCTHGGVRGRDANYTGHEIILSGTPPQE